jgi:hypothetical protein
LVTEFPKDQATAQQNGTALGRHLARTLLSYKHTEKALRFIFQGLSSRENSTGLQCALAAVAELKDRFDLLLPFTRHIINNHRFKKDM